MRNSKFLQLLYKSWENQRPMKYFGRSLILVAERTKMHDDRNLEKKPEVETLSEEDLMELTNDQSLLESPSLLPDVPM